MKQEVVNHLTWLINNLSQTNTFVNWEDAFKAQENSKAFDAFYKSLIKNKHIYLENLTVEEAQELRFSKWSEEIPNLYLFPLWVVPLIPDGTECVSISGERFKFNKSSVDNDIRFGCVAYGIEIGTK